MRGWSVAVFVAGVAIATLVVFADDRDREGDRLVTPFTTLAGLYGRQTGAPPVVLPQRWLDCKPHVALDTPFNFVADFDFMAGTAARG